jgi:TPR repeat protein
MSQDFAEIQRLAEQGLTAYQIEIGHSYLTGRDPNGQPCEIDFERAKYWIERAHEKGATTATFILGTMYGEGKGVAQDTRRAIQLFLDASHHGSYLAELALARLYKNQGDPSAARSWYRRVLEVESEVDDPAAMDEARQFLSLRSIP